MVKPSSFEISEKACALLEVKGPRGRHVCACVRREAPVGREVFSAARPLFG